MRNKKGGNLWIIVVIVVALLAFWFWSMHKESGVMTNEDNYTSPQTDTTPSTEDTSTGSINAGAPAASISYTEALVKYKDARLQIEKTCQASPDNMTFKNGASLMIDNRSAVAHTVKVGSSFPIKGYGFKIVKLESSKLPATWYVDCDSSQNVSTILIQK